jgi:hypothetical protein
VLRRRTRNRHADRARLASIALAAAAFAGCGGGDETATDPPGVSRPIAKVRFLAEADRICHSTNARIEAAADGLATRRRQSPPAEVRRVVPKIVVPTRRSEVEAIRSLGAPAGDEAKAQAILAATERGIRQIEADPVGVLDRPPRALREAGRLAQAYGSAECDLRYSASNPPGTAGALDEEQSESEDSSWSVAGAGGVGALRVGGSLPVELDPVLGSESTGAFASVEFVSLFDRLSTDAPDDVGG